MSNPFAPEAKEIPVPEIKENEVKIDIKEMDRKIRIECCELVHKNGGEWTGERGNSEWRPDKDVEPGDRNGTNPENKTWGDIMKKYDFESIPFKDGKPDF